MVFARPMNPQQLREAYRRVTDRVAEAAARAGRHANDVLLVAVTKYASPDQIRALVEMGHRDFGENRVQQLLQRVTAIDEFVARRKLLGHAREDSPTQKDDSLWPQVVMPTNQSPPATTRQRTRSTRRAATLGEQSATQGGAGTSPVRWHMIGHLQRNKVKQVVPLVRLIHSLDSLRLAEELHQLGARREKPIEVLLQINASGEESKFGLALPAAAHVAEQIDTMVHLRLRGLMTMAPWSEKPENARRTFARTAELFDDMRRQRIGGDAFNILSMGMTDDFEVAIAEGANMVRVGRAIFGDAPEDAGELDGESVADRGQSDAARITRENESAAGGRH